MVSSFLYRDIGFCCAELVFNAFCVCVPDLFSFVYCFEFQLSGASTLVLFTLDPCLQSCRCNVLSQSFQLFMFVPNGVLFGKGGGGGILVIVTTAILS